MTGHNACMEHPGLQQDERQIDLKIADTDAVQQASASLPMQSDAAPTEQSGADVAGPDQHMHTKISMVRGCTSKWADMQGDDCVRTCGVCHLNVHSLADSSINDFVAQQHSSDRAQLFRRPDGTYMLEDCGAKLAFHRTFWRDWWTIMTHCKQFSLSLPAQVVLKKWVLFYFTVTTVDNLFRHLVLDYQETVRSAAALQVMVAMGVEHNHWPPQLVSVSPVALTPVLCLLLPLFQALLWCCISFVVAGGCFILARLLGGKAGYRQTYAVVAASAAPSLFNSFAWPLAAIASLWIFFSGLRHVHKLGAWRAIAFAVIVFCLIGVPVFAGLLWLAVAGLGMQTGNSTCRRLLIASFQSHRFFARDPYPAINQARANVS